MFTSSGTATTFCDDFYSYEGRKITSPRWLKFWTNVKKKKNGMLVYIAVIKAKCKYTCT